VTPETSPINRINQNQAYVHDVPQPVIFPSPNPSQFMTEDQSASLFRFRVLTGTSNHISNLRSVGYSVSSSGLLSDETASLSLLILYDFVIYMRT
jgi:hypothetical protein